MLAQHLQKQPREYSYRFLFIPGTIGSITWLALNQSRIPRIKHGFVIAGVGDKGPFTYKRSRRGDAEIDRAFSYVLKQAADASRIIDFHPYGYDERQFCSPGFNLPVGCAMRTPFGEYPEYHTSADNLDFVAPEALVDSFDKCVAVLDVLENNRVYLNQNPYCEPQLGKRGPVPGRRRPEPHAIRPDGGALGPQSGGRESQLTRYRRTLWLSVPGHQECCRSADRTRSAEEHRIGAVIEVPSIRAVTSAYDRIQ